MSSFFDVDESETEEKDIVGTTLASKGTTPPTADLTGPSSAVFEQITIVVTPSAIMAAKDEGSSKPALAEDKGKGLIKFEEAKKASKDDTPLGEGPFDQDLGGRRYRAHHATGKVMGAKQLAEAIGFAEQLGYPSGSTIFGGRPDGYLYCCQDNMEIEVCRYMVDNNGFPKLEAMPLTMSSEIFSNCLAYTHLKILEKDFIDSQTEVLAMRKEKSKLKASNAVKDNQIASLEAELKRAREKHEAKMTKLMQASTEVAINLSSAKVKIDELKYEMNHVIIKVKHTKAEAKDVAVEAEPISPRATDDAILKICEQIRYEVMQGKIGN
ncbi:hypothetical protein ZEAMMB73_Zm00001d010002 [Zea mays]|uniref:Uncharacterized protein n=1 Tax=Zea mays TaxID=4577 RepID=A0A1D6FNI7_MAIZE|nr:hypothetical protein ZEAMMB73_Zm00001d010002 [Zea mays]